MTEITQADRKAAHTWWMHREHDERDLPAYFARHRMEERAAIVAWLRSDKIVLSMDGSAEEVANAIEAGDHWRPFV